MQHNPGFLKLVEAVKKGVQECQIEDVQVKLKAQSPLILVDVREDNEWQAGHIPGALHLGRGIIERDIETKIPDKNAEIILYCGGGFRSALAAESLQKMGYTNVISMDGLRLRPGVQCVVSAPWPIATLHAAHAAGTAEAGEALFERARARIAAGEGEAALVARDGWRASVRAIGAPTAAFMQVVARDLSLAHALTAAGDDFDFAAWLADALRCQWLLRVEPWRG